MAEVFGAKGLDPDEVQARMRKVAAELGLPLGRRTRTYNSTRAQELGHWAAQQGVGHAFHEAMFKASFVDCLAISQPSVLAQVAASVGLDPDQALDHLTNGAFRPQVEADWDLSRQLGISAAPTFVAGGRMVVGAQPYPVLERLVQAAGAPARTA